MVENARRACTNWYEAFVYGASPGSREGRAWLLPKSRRRQLLKAMTWWDGFVVALANPGFLIAALGRLDRRTRHDRRVRPVDDLDLPRRAAEQHPRRAVDDVPDKSGGIALYAHEAWRKYLTFDRAAGDVRLLDRLVGRPLDQRPGRRHADPVRVVLEERRGPPRAPASTSRCRSAIGIGLIVLVWLFNVYGVRPAVWFGYLTGALLCIPVFVLMFLPYITGRLARARTCSGTSAANGGLAARASTWLYFMCWSSYGIEVVATFAPEYHDTAERHAEGAARPRRCSASPSTRCCRSAWAARSGRRRRSPTIRRSSPSSPRRSSELVGNGLAQRHDRLHRRPASCSSMNTATMDGSQSALRHLQGRDDDQAARGAQPLPRARPRDDARRRS